MGGWLVCFNWLSDCLVGWLHRWQGPPPPCANSHKVPHIIAQPPSTLHSSTWSVSGSLCCSCAACCLNHTDCANVATRRLPRYICLTRCATSFYPTWFNLGRLCKFVPACVLREVVNLATIAQIAQMFRHEGCPGTYF